MFKKLFGTVTSLSDIIKKQDDSKSVVYSVSAQFHGDEVVNDLPAGLVLEKHLVIEKGVKFVNKTSLRAKKGLTNSGYIVNGDSNNSRSQLSVGNEFKNNGQLKNKGIFSVMRDTKVTFTEGSEVLNLGTFDNDGEINVYGSIYNNRLLCNKGSISIDLDTGSLNASAGSKFENRGTYNVLPKKVARQHNTPL
ncbi:hypothetical protein YASMINEVIRUS_1527 [Yasminevirus sp. GU-2018]|uniref:Uncharacterized protein n=1 Tax=Yasminevirus sp. GU-2018 TaxID=2420051 RepID=A0A5K0UBA1_9VIRU|nr:hypothetical protein YASMINEVIRUS_1527 [Yasminevirus sp. GU-2018]